MEELLTPMVGRQWCHLDLWADNLRGTPDGGVCVIDFDNAGPAEPTGSSPWCCSSSRGPVATGCTRS